MNNILNIFTLIYFKNIIKNTPNMPLVSAHKLKFETHKCNLLKFKKTSQISRTNEALS